MQEAIRAVEQNLFAWRRIFAHVEGVPDYGAPDVEACVSDDPLHVFNGIYNARFGDWRGRGETVAADFVARRRP